MTDATNLTNHFLIAMPGLSDPNFFHTVTYICDHTPNGAMGIIINRPSGIDLGMVFDQMDISCEANDQRNQPVYEGGPVQKERGFILHRGNPDQWESSVSISKDITLTTSADILNDMAASNGPNDSLIALGYAGWSAQQLEEEIADNAWLFGPADPSIIFDEPVEKRWEKAANLLGIDISLISHSPGHA